MIKAKTPEGMAAGIALDSLYSGYLLSLMSEDRLQDSMGQFSDQLMQKAEERLKAALGIQ